MNITIDYEPTAKGRPRVKFLSGRVLTYTPTKTQEAQNAIREIVRNQIKKSFPPHTPLKLTAVFYRTKSKWLKKSETLPFRKPDLDNFSKCLNDAINGILFPDDAQICSLDLKKRWSKNNHGYITLLIEEDKL